MRRRVRETVMMMMRWYRNARVWIRSKKVELSSILIQNMKNPKLHTCAKTFRFVFFRIITLSQNTLPRIRITKNEQSEWCETLSSSKEREREKRFLFSRYKSARCVLIASSQKRFLYSNLLRVCRKKRETLCARIKKRKKKKVTQKVPFACRAVVKRSFRRAFESRRASRETSGVERYNYSSAKSTLRKWTVERE